MASVNKWIGIGNLGANPELKYLPSGQAVCDLRIACNDAWTDKQGQRQERTEWVSVTVFGKQAENASQYLAKGRQVYVEGRLQTQSWDDKNTGEKKYRTLIVAERIQFLGGGQGQGQGDASGAAASGGSGGGRQRGEATGSGGGGQIGAVFPPYGKAKGQPVRGATTNDLQFYRNGCMRTLADPNKANYHEKERALLAAIDAEIARQGGQSSGGGGFGGESEGGGGFGGSASDVDWGTTPGSDDEVPF